MATETAGGPSDLEKVVSTFRERLYLPDPGPLLMMLGTIAANRMLGEPVWSLFVGPPGGGKTEILQAAADLPYVHSASTITEAGLLSGTPKKERAPTAKGGLLPTMGKFGIILCKDFTSVLSMHRDGRQAVLAALREVYDGHWVRHLGSDGGLTLSWKGKAGFLGACTGTIDRHHAVMAAMGERFLLYRMPRVDEAEQARRALDHAASGSRMRSDLSAVVGEFFQGLSVREVPPVAGQERERLVQLASFVARCRSAVERDGYRRDVELVPDPEAPNRIVIVLDRLLAGLRVIGVDSKVAWSLVCKVGLDCLPIARRKIIETLAEDPTAARDFKTLEEAIGYQGSSARRAIEDLQAHGVLAGSRKPGVAYTYNLSEWAQERIGAVYGFSETSGESSSAPRSFSEVSGDPPMSSSHFFQR